MSACVQGCSCRLCSNSIPLILKCIMRSSATYTCRSAGRNKLCRMTPVYGSLISPCRMTHVYMVVLLARLPNQGIDHQKLVLEHWEGCSTLSIFHPPFPFPSPPIFSFLAPLPPLLPPYLPSLTSLPTLFSLSGLVPPVKLVRFDLTTFLTTLLDHCCLKCVRVSRGKGWKLLCSSISQHVKQPHPLPGNMKRSLPLIQL